MVYCIYCVSMRSQEQQNQGQGDLILFPLPAPLFNKGVSMKMEDLLALSSGMDEKKTDYITPLEDVWFSYEAALVVNNSTFGDAAIALAPTDWALRQICEKLGPPPVKYMHRCPSELRADNLNYWLREMPQDEYWFVRAYGSNCRAVLSRRYVPIANTTVLSHAQKLLTDVGHWLIDPYVSPDTLHVKLGMAQQAGGAYAVGAYVGNGEIGNRSFRILPFVQKTSCSNSIIYAEGGFVQRHVSVTSAFIYGALKEKLGRVFGLAANVLERMVMAEAEEIPEIAKVVDTICRQYNLSQAVKDNILLGTEGEKTRMGLVNGISFAAHASDLPMEAQIDLETLAGAQLIGRSSVSQDRVHR